MRVHEVYLSNFRCFRDPTTVPFGRITLLVGENSTGKSALLAALGGLSPFGKPSTPLIPDFNAPPFQLGRFEDIVTRRTNMPRHSRTFTVGVSVAASREDSRDGEVARTAVIGEYENLDGKPVARVLHVYVPGLLVSLRRCQSKRGDSTYEYAFCHSPEGSGVTELGLKQIAYGRLCESSGAEYSTLPFPEEMLGTVTPLVLLTVLAFHPSAKGRDKGLKPMWPVLDFLSGQGVHHLAPIRAVPQRTYESFAEAVTPEGSHVPFVLERETRPSAASQLMQGLRDFGEESGLFSDVQVRRFGEPKGSRFAVFVEIGGAFRNITDVGYGVPQVLPPVLDALRLPTETIVTMQEPEVHLHPRAQAALGSLLAKIAVGNKKSFVVETHSDYLVDRVRQEVARGTIDCGEVVILFFSQTTRGSRVVPIRVDQYGKPVNPPKGYRSFFLREALALLDAE